MFQFSKEDLALQKITNFFLIIIGVYVTFIILQQGASLLIPLVIAFIISSILISLFTFFKKYFFFKIPAILLTAFVFLGFFYLSWEILRTTVADILANDRLERNILQLVDDLISLFGNEEGKSAQKYLDEFLENQSLGSFLTNSSGFTFNFSFIWNTILSIFSNMGSIIIYTIFIIAEYKYFGKKILSLAVNDSQTEKLSDTLEQIRDDVKLYFLIHTVASLVTGGLTYLMCILFGVDFPLFWGFLAFVFNYIPTIGSFIGGSFPVLYSIIQFPGEYYLILFLASVSFCIQFIIGNIIEPKFMGDRLNLSPLVILLSITFWGYIWGIPGMFLSVPIMVIINIVFSRFRSTKWMHILLSEKGETYKTGHTFPIIEQIESKKSGKYKNLFSNIRYTINDFFR